ncbi:hypothetical protein ACW3SX_03260 [Streptococcus pneumoniae]
MVYETSSEIVSKVKVGEGTLNRFCKRLDTLVFRN